MGAGGTRHGCEGVRWSERCKGARHECKTWVQVVQSIDLNVQNMVTMSANSVKGEQMGARCARHGYEGGKGVRIQGV